MGFDCAFSRMMSKQSLMHSEQMYTFGPAMILSTSRWGLWQKEQARPDGFEYLGMSVAVVLHQHGSGWGMDSSRVWRSVAVVAKKSLGLTVGRMVTKRGRERFGSFDPSL